MYNIGSSLASIGSSFSSLIQGDHQEPQAVEEPLDIPREIISKAVLDKQSNGDLRFMAIDRRGFPEYRIFANEKRLDHFLSQNSLVDIWEIEDRRQKDPRTTHK